MRKALATLALAISSPALAAIVTVPVGGKILLPSGAACSTGTYAAVLNTPASAPDGATMQAIGLAELTGVIAADGTVSYNIIANDIMTPTDTVYTFTYTCTLASGVVRTWKDYRRVPSTPTPTTHGAIPRVNAPPGVTIATVPAISGSVGNIVMASGVGGGAATDSDLTWDATLNQLTGVSDVDGNGTAASADWNGDGTPDEVAFRTNAGLYAPRVFGATSSGVISQGYGSAAWTPGSTHISALEAARAHAMMWGDPTYYLQPAVFDTWDEIFRNHPLYADCDNNATPGGSCANEQPAPAIARCYNNDCIQDVGFYCIDSTGDASGDSVVDYDGTAGAEFAVGDIVLAGQPSGNISKGGPTHRIIAITRDTSVCGSVGNGDNKIQVDPAVNQNAAYEIDIDANGTVDTGVSMVRLYKNDTHPSNVGADHMGLRLAYAPRLMYGRQGPNLLRNGSLDWNTVTENITGVGCTVTARTWLATPTTGLTDRDAREGPAYNSIDCGTSVTSTDYLEWTDAITVVPGERYVVAGLLKSNDRAIVSYVDDRNNDGTFSDAADMQYQLAVLQPANQYANALAPFWATFEIPVGAGGGGGAVGIHRIKVRWAKGGTTANSPQLDMFTLRKVTTWDTDSVIEGGRASNVFLINDPGPRNIVVTGDSWMTSANLGVQFAKGLARGLLARTGHDYTSQIIPTGASGQGVAYMLDNFYDMIEKYEPLYVVVQIGTNDVIGGTTQANYIARCRMLAQRIVSIGAIPIFLTQAPLGPAGGANMTTSHNYKDALWRALMN
jgi:lysophospholipase L1-like esterase